MNIGLLFLLKSLAEILLLEMKLKLPFSITKHDMENIVVLDNGIMSNDAS